MSKYMITDGRYYLRKDTRGNFVPVKNKLLGYVWEQRKTAQNIIQNCINKNLRNRYHVLEIADTVVPKQTTVKSEIIVKPKDEVAKQIGSEAIEKNHLNDLTESIDKLSGFVQNTEQRKEELLTALSDVDKEISDIHHYIEFGRKFNAYQGWLAFNMLRNRLKKRREIKDELYILIQLGECKVNSEMLSEIKNTIGKFNTREYQPRILKQLFQ